MTAKRFLWFADEIGGKRNIVVYSDGTYDADNETVTYIKSHLGRIVEYGSWDQYYETKSGDINSLFVLFSNLVGHRNVLTDIKSVPVPTNNVDGDLMFTDNHTKSTPFDHLEAKVIRHVRTPAGVERFGQPIGTVIVGGGVGHALRNVSHLQMHGSGHLSVRGSDGHSYHVRRRSDGRWDVLQNNHPVAGLTGLPKAEDALGQLDNHITPRSGQPAPRRDDGVNIARHSNLANVRMHAGGRLTVRDRNGDEYEVRNDNGRWNTYRNGEMVDNASGGTSQDDALARLNNHVAGRDNAPAPTPDTTPDITRDTTPSPEPNTPDATPDATPSPESDAPDTTTSPEPDAPDAPTPGTPDGGTPEAPPTDPYTPPAPGSNSIINQIQDRLGNTPEAQDLINAIRSNNIPNTLRSARRIEELMRVVPRTETPEQRQRREFILRLIGFIIAKVIGAMATNKPRTGSTGGSNG